MIYNELTQKEKNFYNLVIKTGLIDFDLSKPEFKRVIAVLIDYIAFGGSGFSSG